MRAATPLSQARCSMNSQLTYWERQQRVNHVSIATIQNFGWLEGDITDGSGHSRFPGMLQPELGARLLNP